MFYGLVGILGLAGAALLALWLVILLVLVFEVWMFVHVIQNHAITTNVKVLWLLGMLILHPFVAIAYFFTDYQKAR